MKEKLKDAIYGLTVGDALGVPFEFQNRGEFKCTDMIGYGTHNQPEGTWSDDTSMTLATCMSIKNKGCVDLIDIRNQFEKWLLNNEYTLFNEVFDCGNTCYCAIKDKCGQTDEWSNGNGSLMRIIPLAFIKEISDKTIEDVSAITHAHNISKDICVKYIHIAKDLLGEMNLKDAIKKETSNEFFDELLKCNEDNIISGSFVVDSFKASLWCLLKTDNYKDCVLKAVNLGDDTDTIAAIAGGLAGIVYGYDSIPKDWIEKLQRKDLIEECLFKPSENNLVAFIFPKQKGCDIMCRCKMGNPKKMSRFICLKCLQVGIPGIQRKSQREKYHVKDLFCTCCKQETKHIEIRHCDWMDEVMMRAEELHREYYL